MAISEKIVPELPSSLTRVIRTAVSSATEGITISNMRDRNAPLIYANPAFYQITGYPVAEVMGRNCRFLQGEKTDTSAVEQIRLALTEQESCVIELLNYRKDRSPFWNRLSLVPILDS